MNFFVNEIIVMNFNEHVQLLMNLSNLSNLRVSGDFRLRQFVNLRVQSRVGKIIESHSKALAKIYTVNSFALLSNLYSKMRFHEIEGLRT